MSFRIPSKSTLYRTICNYLDIISNNKIKFHSPRMQLKPSRSSDVEGVKIPRWSYSAGFKRPDKYILVKYRILLVCGSSKHRNGLSHIRRQIRKHVLNVRYYMHIPHYCGEQCVQKQMINVIGDKC